MHNDPRTMCKSCLEDYNDVFVLCQNNLILLGLLDAGIGNHKQLFYIDAHLVHSTQNISYEVQSITFLI